MLSIAGKFTLHEKICDTHYHEVHRGTRDADSHPIVAKLLRSRYPTAIELAALRHEYEVLRDLEQSSVVRPLALEKTGNGLTLILDDVGMRSLSQVVAMDDLTIRQRLALSIKLTEVIKDIHQAGVIHKDIKPAHVFLLGDDLTQVTLVDFGIATRLSREGNMEALPKHLEGSLGYIAPEQTGRVNRAVDSRSDLYSLGATLYELFAKQPPFPNADPLELIHCHIAIAPRKPGEVNPDIPPALSEIIMRLLNKAAEERYQTASGVLRDLRECLRREDEQSSQRSFELGRHDVADQLAIPEKLYGRETELSELIDALRGAADGGLKLFELSGQSGIGKSALVREFRGRTAGRCRFATGKFEYVNRGVPYAALGQVCGSLTRGAMTESAADLQRIRKALLRGLAGNGGVLLDLVPELEQLLGPQPAVANLGSMEARVRFERTFQAFLEAFASTEQPLVVFLDDMQWADASSLRLLEGVAANCQQLPILLIEAYREEEVDSAHPLLLSRQAIVKAGITPKQLSLGALGVGDVQTLLADTLRRSRNDVKEVAQVLLARTDGNPFFLGQLLLALQRERKLHLNESRTAWEWDLTQVGASSATDNVVAFMLRKLEVLSEPAQRVMRLAACVGHTFDLDSVAAIANERQAALCDPLWEVLQEGLLLPLDDEYRLLPQGISTDHQLVDGLNPRFRFLHDRVQQAAYALIDGTEKQAVHLEVARRLWKAAESADGGATPALEGNVLFEVVDHYAQGVEQLREASERQRVAELSLAAATRAKSASAASAVDHYSCLALTLFNADETSEVHRLVHQARLLQCEARLLQGKLTEALEAARTAEEQARGKLDQVGARLLRVQVLFTMGQLGEACEVSVETLRLLGVDLPDPGDKAALGAAIGAEFGACQQALTGRDVGSLAELPTMTDPEQLALLFAAAGTIPPAYQCNQELMVLVVLKAVQVPLSHGTSPVSPFFYAQYGISHAVVTGDFKRALEFGDLAIGMLERPEHRGFAGSINFLVAGFLAPWCRPISEIYDALGEGMRQALAVGDQVYASYSATISALARLVNGGELPELRKSVQAYIPMMRRTEDILNTLFLQSALHSIAALEGASNLEELANFDIAALEKGGPPPVLASMGTTRAMEHFVFRRFKEAYESVRENPPLPIIIYSPDHVLYQGLAAAQLASDASGEEQENFHKAVAESVAQMATWNETGPANFAHRLALLQAEQFRIQGNTVEAMTSYERAIDNAKEGGFLNHQALACELCARLHLSAGRTRGASSYLQEAAWAYGRWGAMAKVNALYAEFPAELVREQLQSSPAATYIATATTGGIAGHVDLTTAIRAAEAIVTELDSEKVLGRLMHTLVEYTGAQRGFLLIPEERGFRIEAHIDVEASGVIGHGGTPENRGFSDSIALYTSRTLAPVILADAGSSETHGQDPYVLEAKPKSVLSAPMLHRGELAGVIYLENNSAPGVFNAERLGLLQFISAQAAGAIQNARLYGEVAAAKEHLKAANDNLEKLVTERTNELKKTVAELWSEMDLARKIQTVLLPKTTRVKNFEIAAKLLAADSVGGDYYDVVETDGAPWLLIGDVTGHGVTAGLIMMMIQTSIRTVLSSFAQGQSLSPAQVLSLVNAAVRENLRKIGDGDYMTIAALELDGSEVRFAGHHEEILVYRAATKKVETVETQGIWLGVRDDISGILSDQTLHLEPGDLMLLFTDGITERMVDGQMVQIDGLREQFTQLVERTQKPAELIQELLEPLGGESLKDDVTLVAARFDPE